MAIACRPAAVLRCGEDHCLVAADIGLRGKHVHRLRARGARQPLHGEAGEPRSGVGFHCGAVVRVEKTDHDRAALEEAHFPVLRTSHLEDDVGARKILRARDDFRACRFEFTVGDARRHPRAGLDVNRVAAARGEFLDGLGSRGDARLPRTSLGRNADLHGYFSLVALSAAESGPTRTNDTTGRQALTTRALHSDLSAIRSIT